MGWRYWLFVAGRAISVLGDGFGTIALGWLVYDLTGSKLAMGSLYLAGMVPEILLRLFGAPLLDRVNRPRLMAALDVTQAIVYLGPLLLYMTGHLSLVHLYVLEVVAGAARALYRPAVLAMVPSLVPQASLTRAVSLMDGTLQAALVTGPVVAGLVVAFLPSPAALALDALTFGVSALALVTISNGIAGAKSDAPTIPYRQQLLEGFTFFRQMPSLFLLTLMLGVTYMSSWAIFTMHAPYAKEHLEAGPQIVGAMQACWPLGFLAGTALLAWRGEVRRRRTLMLTSLVGVGIALGGLGLVPKGYVALALALKMLEGFCFSLFSNTSTVLFGRLVPDRLLGRVMSVRMLLAWGGNPIGAFLGGYLGSRIGLGPTFVLAGGLSVLVGLAGFFIESIHEVDKDLTPATAAAN